METIGSFDFFLLPGVQPTGEANESAEFDNLWIASVARCLQRACRPQLSLGLQFPQNADYSEQPTTFISGAFAEPITVSNNILYSI